MAVSSRKEGIRKVQLSWRIALGVVGIATFWVWLLYLGVYRVDDAYIVYRYAENISRGFGIAFNPGEPVEGVTCFLWTLLLATVPMAGLSLPRVAPLLTAAAGTAVVLLTPRVSARLQGRSSVGPGDVAAAVLLAANPAFAYWSTGALETVPYAFLLVLAAHAHRRDIEEDRGRSSRWLALAVLTRPEAPLVAGAFALDRILTRRRWRADVRWAVPIVGALIGLFAFRRWYFHAWLPNTFYAKTGAGIGETARVGWWYTLDFLANLGPSFGHNAEWTVLMGGAIALVLVLWGLRHTELRLAALVPLALAFAVVLEGGDWMVLHRFWVPCLPFLAILLGAAGERLSRFVLSRSGSGRRPRDSVSSRRIGVACIVSAGLLLIGSYLVYGIRQRDGPNGLAANAEGYRYAHHAVARFLRAHSAPGDTVALMDIGIIGYETGLRILDITGLTDPRIARSPGGFLNKRYPPDWIFAERPRFVVLVDGFPIDTRIALYPEFLRRYRLVMMRNHRFNWSPPQSYTLHVFELAEPHTRGRTDPGSPPAASIPR